MRLSHSGTVRLIDRLEADGLVERHRGADERSAALVLTTMGEQRMQDILTERRRTLEQAIEPLSFSEQAQLTALLEKLLTHLTCGREQADFVCQLCEIEACPLKTCPVSE